MSAEARRCPYVGLVPYAEEDWEFFFGRETETELIIANLVAARLTLLFGASGVGKSSVLRAGVVHRLTQQAAESRAASGLPESAVAVFREWRDEPLASLTRAIRDAVGRATGRDPGPVPQPAGLADAFAAWTDLLGGEILVILDQFEEYLLYHSREDGEGTFAVEFPRMVNRQGLRVNFLLALREDAVARLDRFKGRIPNLFENYLRLQHLGFKAAEEAIRGPLGAHNAERPAEPVGIEDELVQEVLRQTRTGQVRAGGGAAGPIGAEDVEARIETPYLQMVMTRVWDEEQAAGSHTLRLATLVEDPPRGLGGADQIVRTHLDREMAGLDAAERDVAAEAFRFLVTRTGTKIALAVEDLAGYTSLPAERLAPVLDKLAAGGRRILRPVPLPDRPEMTRYEIFHDVLGPAIADWRRRHEAGREQERIRREEEARRLEELEAAETRRQRQRSRYLKIGVTVLSIGAVVLGWMSFVAYKRGLEVEKRYAEAVLAQKQAELARAQAEDAARQAQATAQAAIQARAVQATRFEPSRAAEGARLREAFLSGDTAAVEETARRLGLLNERVRFQSQRAPKHYRIEQGDVYEFTMRPVAESVPGGLQSLAAVTFKMNHPTFRNKVLAGDPAQGFRAGYTGWGCLSTVPVLLEYVDPRKPPEVALFPMCDRLETLGRSTAS
jgi:hypothetical protein